MKKIGLLGHPIEHSLSPKVFSAGYKDIKEISSGYTYELINEPDFEKAFAIFKKEGFIGANVTSPFKEKILSKVDRTDDIVSRTKAANIIKYNSKKELVAYNSDYWAVNIKLRNLLNFDFSLRSNARILVLGCGGSGRAAALASTDLGVKTAIVNRTESKCSGFACSIGAQLAGFSRLEYYFNQADIIIYTLPVPLPEDILRNLTIENKIIFESNYSSPSIVKNLSDIHVGSFTYISGREWLLLQAMKGFEIFTGTIPDYGSMKYTI